MKNTIKNLSKLVAGAALLASSQLYAASGVCAVGYITKFYAGGWNQDGFIIKMEYTDGTTPPNTFYMGTLRFDPALQEGRLKAIQSAAMLAMANGNKVEVFRPTTHPSGSHDCPKMTQIKVMRNTSS